jgi:diaminobutyrate-2-oxoglutarate transaminase
VIETSGSEGQVVKCLCPLVIESSDLDRAVAILSDAADEATGRARPVSLKRVS